MVYSLIVILITFLIKNRDLKFNDLYLGLGYILLLFVTLILRLNDISFNDSSNLVYFMLFSGGILSFIYILIDYLRNKKNNINTYLYFMTSTIVLMNTSWFFPFLLLTFIILDEHGVKINNRKDFSVLLFSLLLFLTKDTGEVFEPYIKISILLYLFVVSLKKIKTICSTALIVLGVLHNWNFMSDVVFYYFPVIYLFMAFIHSEEIKQNIINKFKGSRFFYEFLEQIENDVYIQKNIVVKDTKTECKVVHNSPLKTVDESYLEYLQIVILVLFLVFTLSWGYSL